MAMFGNQNSYITNAHFSPININFNTQYIDKQDSNNSL